MGSKSAPAPQDFTQAAQQMGQSSLQGIAAQTAANRPDQYMPGGSSVTWQNTPGSGYQWGADNGIGSDKYNAATWQGFQGTPEMQAAQQQVDANGYGGGDPMQAAYDQWSQSSAGQQYAAKQLGVNAAPDQWTQTTQLGPEAQKAFDAQQQLATSRSQTGLDLFNQQAGQVAKPLDMGGLQGWGQSPQQSNLQTSVGQGQLQTQLQGQQLQSAYNFGGAPSMMDPTAANRQGYDAAMGLATRQLDPAWNQKQTAFDADMANQGLRAGDAGYDTAKGNFDRSRTDAYSQAQNQATLTGAQLGNQLFGQSLQGRQQGVGEAQAQGNFGNQAALSAFGMGAQQGQFANQAAGQQFQQGLAGAQFGNQAMGQQFSQQQAISQYMDQLRQSQLNEQMGTRSFGVNQVNGLLGGQQVQAPQFTGFNQAQAAQPTNYLGAAQSQQAANMSSWQAQQQQWAQLYQGASQLAGGAMAFI